MEKLILFTLLLLFVNFRTAAQATDHAWLETSQLKVRVNADGRLFCDDEKGAFLVPNGDTMASLMRGAGIWIGGIDPGNNLHVSAQTHDPVKTDFVAGLRGIPNSGKVWKVTREEIEAHRQDYMDNWVVDNPIPAVFAWPGRGNKFFYRYNGFELPDSMAKFVFTDGDSWNGKYEPQFGECPMLNVPIINGEWLIPSEMICFAFYSDTPQLLTTCPKPFPVQFWEQVFVYDCPENEVLAHSVFVHYFWRTEGADRMDSSTVSVFNDFDIGNPEDDYHGFLPNQRTYFAYNATDEDAQFGAKPPLFFAKLLNSPFGLKLNPFFNEYEEAWFPPGMMPYGCPDSCLVPAGIKEATAPNEFYNYQTGTWRDGTPLTAFGAGYNPGNPDHQYTESAFPGYPEDPAAWTELNAQNPPGNRRALLNCKIGVANPGWVNEMTILYSFVPWEEGSLTQRIQKWEDDYEYLEYRLICCFDNFDDPFQPIGCEYQAMNPPEPDTLTVFPNPADDVIRVWHRDIYLKKMILYDALGRVSGVGVYRDGYSDIAVQDLPAGIYFLQIESREGEKKIVKVMVVHGRE